MASNSPRLAAQRRLIESIQNGPRMAAQRKQIESLFGDAAQRMPGPDEEEMLQGKFVPAQRTESEADRKPRENHTGMPDNLKTGIESLSGMSLDHVRVHYRSAQPAQLNALAYAQGGDIHIAPGQEQHLPHEAWHVVQQAQGRVRPTMQMKDGVSVNDDAGLEHEADVMGAKALTPAAQRRTESNAARLRSDPVKVSYRVGRDDYPVQRFSYQRGATQSVKLTGGTSTKVKTFEICTYNSVSYKKGDARQSGTGTGTADWKGWLIDQGTGNNATQLHVVNQEWGGQGGANDGNVGPGSQNLNGQHKGPEAKFKNLFNNKGIANYDMEYTCAFDYSGGLLPYDGTTITQDVKIPDPDISCHIEANDQVSEKFGEGWMVPGEHGKGMLIRDGG